MDNDMKKSFGLQWVVAFMHGIRGSIRAQFVRTLWLPLAQEAFPFPSPAIGHCTHLSAHCVYICAHFSISATHMDAP